MKLYFYKLNTDGRYGKVGITVQVCEAEEKPKTYCTIGNNFFPGYSSRIRKESIGEIDSGQIILTEPNFEYAKKKFKELAESVIAQAKERLEREENKLKIIEESEE